MRYLLLFIFFINFSFGLEILAKSFEFNKSNNLGIFKGDVNVTKQQDNILSDILYLYTTPNKKIKKIIAIGNVRFKFSTKDSKFKGRSNKLTYLANKDIFIFEGNVSIIDLKDNQEVFGEKIFVDKNNSSVKVLSENKEPIRFKTKDN